MSTSQKAITQKAIAHIKPGCEEKIGDLLREAYELCGLIQSTKIFSHIISQLPDIEEAEEIADAGAGLDLDSDLHSEDENLEGDNLFGDEPRDINLVTRTKLPPRKNKKKKLRRGLTPNGRYTGNGTPTSQFRGVSWQKEKESWRVRLNFRGKPKEVGNFSDEVTAAKAYDKWKYKATGKVKFLNFPEDYK